MFALLILSGCSRKIPQSCIKESPNKTSIATQPVAMPKNTHSRAKDALIGIDGSDSMLGYAQETKNLSWLSLLQSVKLSSRSFDNVRVFRVGGDSAKQHGSDPTLANDPCFFTGCGKFQPRVNSGLQTLWQVNMSQVKASPVGQSPPLRLLISDLQVNHGDIFSLIKSIKTDLDKGSSAGILALKLDFSGPLFDLQGRYISNATLRRPLYLLATGQADQVQDYLKEIRRNLAQKGVISEQLSFLPTPRDSTPLIARDARAIPPKMGSVGKPVVIGGQRFTSNANPDYRFIRLNPGAVGFSVMTMRPWKGGSERPDLRLARLERVPLVKGESTSAEDIQITNMFVSGSQLRLDFKAPESASSAVLRATVPVLPEQWWLDWDHDPKSNKDPTKTEGLLHLLTTLASEIQQRNNSPPAATLCIAFQTVS